ncbi:alpha-L-fucosidase [Bythopirellula polymerisocia]|uniref:alpha-L-fucosidase n=1 Tax=Bythopirellula polymerisocia TaxID=2528003 RepID=UPI0018D40503|nr:alpha-L-fucosidase [Bythopirellula polymerisocia]
MSEIDNPRPAANQLAWQDCELGMFYHFDIPIFKPGWDWRTFEGLPTPQDFNPKELDTDQWLEAARAIGARYAVLVAKHCSGFLTWQSDIYPYGVKQAKWRDGHGDIVADFIASCCKFNVRPGIYASVSANCYWNVDNPGLVNRGRGGDPKHQAEYVRSQERMLEELWGRYGELFYIWFDGGVLAPEDGGPDIVPMYERLQSNANVFQGPRATTRWVGNEEGVADYPCWATVSQLNENGMGSPNGTIWQPGECDVPIRENGWFWEDDQENTIHSLESLMDMYYRSVGHNCNLLINANPDTRGLVPEADMKRYSDLGKEIRTRFNTPVARIAGRGDCHILMFPKPQCVEHVWVMEDIRYGERIRAYNIEALTPNSGWQQIVFGTSVGHKRIHRFKPVQAKKLRMNVTKETSTPVLRDFSAFSAL